MILPPTPPQTHLKHSVTCDLISLLSFRCLFWHIMYIALYLAPIMDLYIAPVIAFYIALHLAPIIAL